MKSICFPLSPFRLLPSAFCLPLSVFCLLPSAFCFLLTADCLLGVMSDAAIGPRPVDPPARTSHSDPE
jgi:hypothetical protein